MYCMLQNCSLWRVFEIFSDEPTKIHFIKEISRKIKLAHTSVKNHLKNLEKEGLIIKKRGERFYGFIANRDNKRFLSYKCMENILKLKESGLIEFILAKMEPRTIVLYGSYLRGEDIESSDIDIFLLSGVKRDLDYMAFSKRLKRNIHIIIERDLKAISKELRANIINGLVLEGYLE